MAKKNGRSLANGEQTIIPEMTPKRIDRIHRAAKRYAVERDARIAANTKEKDAHAFLLNAMKEEGLASYEYGDLQVFVDTAEKVKVKTAGEAAAKGEEGGGGESEE